MEVRRNTTRIHELKIRGGRDTFCEMVAKEFRRHQSFKINASVRMKLFFICSYALLPISNVRFTQQLWIVSIIALMLCFVNDKGKIQLLPGVSQLYRNIID